MRSSRCGARPQEREGGRHGPRAEEDVGLDTHSILSPAHVPHLERRPRDVLAEGRYVHASDSWEPFATDGPHGDTAWPESVPQVVGRPGLSDSARRKLLGQNALRPCPRLRCIVDAPR